jgi:hypothetical protein
MRTRLVPLLVVAAAVVLTANTLPGKPEKGGAGLTVDKDKHTVTIPCTVAPRKLPNLKDVYPLEVIATFPAPKGQKAHETLVNFQVKPSDVHKALESLGLKAGKPGLGEISKATGPEVKLFLEIPAAGGQPKRVPLEETMVDLNTGKAPPAFKWLFTGSTTKQPDPEKDDTVYGADLTGTLISIYPVTNDTVIQSALDAKDEKNYKLEQNKELLPKEGAAVKLIIQAK